MEASALKFSTFSKYLSIQLAEEQPDEAEAALCEDRSMFVLRIDITTLIPDHIKIFMIHSDA